MIDRYAREQMKSVWSTESKYRKWLEVEILVCEAWAELGAIPVPAAEKIRRTATFSLERIDEIESTVRHDVLAFTTAVAEKVGEESRYFHMGLTSSDVLDTALALQLVEAADLMIAGLDDLAAVIAEKVQEYRLVPMMGRTHGIHAEPITAGLKFATWLSAVQRCSRRLSAARESVRVGKISGAVGTYANVDPKVEAYVCERLNLQIMDISTQIIPRDIHADYVTVLAVCASVLDLIATEIRSLQRTEVREMEEPFAAGQKGSSAMPHKRNPVTCEQISGLSRIIRSNAQAALENITLWHERDISHSSVERIILPDSTILLDYLIYQTTRVVRGLRVYPENMARNLELTQGLIYSQRLLLALVEKKMSREAAYQLIQAQAMQAWETGDSFYERIREDPEIRQHLSSDEVEKCFALEYHTKHVDTILARFNI
jgi:adenylosuccinate lyase